MRFLLQPLSAHPPKSAAVTEERFERAALFVQLSFINSLSLAKTLAIDATQKGMLSCARREPVPSFTPIQGRPTK
jgi:hypothetical protein